MLKKSIYFAAIITMLFSSALIVSAQETPSNKKDNHSMKQNDEMNKCMDNIASDRQMKGMMMDKMMDQSEKDSSSMMQMCKKMMNNPEMHKMMMKMMQEESGMMDGKMMNHGMMKPDSLKTMNKSDQELHHKK
ncbi:MAG: hypothetical protein CVV24_06720 [Ignavibacteriae bacterium HGW-Ignavibacteriae-3]|nr:MAG: hypothetical protein CVV24_06720 [Ignavibacteriae bacterium HGW-Ignavibacteriae-3]